MRGRTILMIAAATVFLNTTACKKRVLGEPDSPAQMTQKEFEQRRHEASAFRKVDTGKKLGGPGVFVDPPLSPRVLVEVQGTAMRSTFRLDTRDLGGGTLGPTWQSTMLRTVGAAQSARYRSQISVGRSPSMNGSMAILQPGTDVGRAGR